MEVNHSVADACLGKKNVAINGCFSGPLCLSGCREHVGGNVIHLRLKAIGFENFKDTIAAANHCSDQTNIGGEVVDVVCFLGFATGSRPIRTEVRWDLTSVLSPSHTFLMPSPHLTLTSLVMYITDS